MKAFMGMDLAGPRAASHAFFSLRMAVEEEEEGVVIEEEDFEVVVVVLEGLEEGMDPKVARL